MRYAATWRTPDEKMISGLRFNSKKAARKYGRKAFGKAYSGTIRVL